MARHLLVIPLHTAMQYLLINRLRRVAIAYTMVP